MAPWAPSGLVPVVKRRPTRHHGMGACWCFDGCTVLLDRRERRRLQKRTRQAAQVEIRRTLLETLEAKNQGLD